MPKQKRLNMCVCVYCSHTQGKSWFPYNHSGRPVTLVSSILIIIIILKIIIVTIVTIIIMIIIKIIIVIVIYLCRTEIGTKKCFYSHFRKGCHSQ